MNQIKKLTRFNKRRQEIVNLAKQYLEKDGTIDMSKFRQEQGSAYSRLTYYFNGVNGLMDELSPFISRDDIDTKESTHIKNNNYVSHNIKRSTGRGCPINAQSVRNELAYDMLLLLRKNHTFQEIGDLYGVSRAHIHQLVNILEKNIATQERKVDLEMLM